MPISGSPAHAAVVHLRGHTPTAAHLEVARFPAVAWIGRIVLHVLGWLVSTAATLLITFDPFIASFPLVIGLAMVYRSVRGRYRVDAFRGTCPRCAGELELKPGTRIPLPYPVVCYRCHHEPELRIG